MWQILVIFGTALVIGFSGALVPGPLFTVAVTESARRGFFAGPRLVFGHGLIELALVVALAAGLSTVIKHGAVTGSIGLIGGAFLLWMGFDIARGALRGTIKLEATGHAGRSARRIVLAGGLVSMANPYWVLWWATIGTTYVLLALKQGIIGLGAFYVGHVLSDLIWYSFISFLISTGRSFMNERVYRGILGACGLFLLGLGGWFFASGVNFVRVL
jgi:threonine/homoserine/homoserine lactone efflux protein